MVNNISLLSFPNVLPFITKGSSGISCCRLLKGVVLLLEVTVHQNQVDKALKALKRQMTKEGLLKELKRRRFYEKPSVKKKRKQKEAKKKRKSAMRRSFS
jgi:small subunit ribosomal protein S21